MLDLLDCLMPACHEAGGSFDGRADGVELLGRCRLCGHRGYAEEEGAK
jgi:hypothetical protein